MEFRAMTSRLAKGASKAMLALLAVILFQILCVAVLLRDVTLEMQDLGAFSLGKLFSSGLLPEVVATAGLVLGILFELALLRHLMRRNSDLEKSLQVAAGALTTLIDAYFTEWGLTPTERDVATFTIKGYSISEIARLRGSAEGTIKTHLNAIYRKSGLAGRTQLVSLMVEDLMRAPLGSGAVAAPAAIAAQ